MRSLLVAIFVLSASIHAQELPAAPSLTVEQKQAIQLLLKDAEIAQLRQQLLKAEFDKASALLSETQQNLTVLVRSVQVDGWVFDLQTQSYQKALTDKDGNPLKLPAEAPK